MNCPKCQHPMAKYPLDGCLVDYCDACKGIWCDSLEIQAFKLRVVKDNVAQLVTQLRLELMQEKARPALPMYCPRCVDKPLKTCRINGLSIEVCYECDGMFFDKDELEQYLHYEKPWLVKLYMWFMKTIYERPMPLPKKKAIAQ